MVTLRANKIFLYYIITSILSCRNYNKCVREVESNDLFIIETQNIDKVSVTYKTNHTTQKVFLERFDSESNLYKLTFCKEIRINKSDTIFIKTPHKNYHVTKIQFTEVESHGNPCMFEYELNGINTGDHYLVIK